MDKIYYYLLTLCFFFSFSPHSFSHAYETDSLLSILQGENDLSGEREAQLLYYLGHAHFLQEDYENARQYFSNSLAISEQEGLRWLTMENYFNLGTVLFWQADYQSSVQALHHSLEDYSDQLKLVDSVFIIDQLGHSYFYMGNLDMAMEYRLTTLELATRHGDSIFIAESLCALAETQKEQGLYARALKNLQRSFDISKRQKSPENTSFCLDLMGDIAHEKGNFQEALDYKMRACEIFDTAGQNYNQAYCYHTLAVTYAKLGDHDQAIALFARALAKREQSGQLEEAVQSAACLGELLALEGQCGRGSQMILESLSDAQRLDVLPLERDIYHKLYQVSKHCGNFEQALHFQEKYFQLRDSISSQNTQLKIASLDSKQELQEQEHKLTILEKNKRLSTLYIALLVGAIVFLLVTGGFMYRLVQKQKNFNHLQGEKASMMLRQNAALEWANEKLQNANEELEQFAYLASHDLKAPLRTIGSYASLIKRRYRELLDEDGRTFLSFITEDVKHMNALLEDILAYSNVSKAEVEKDHVDLNEKAELALRILDGAIQKKDAIVEFQTLPTVLGNSTQLFQIFQNLIDNALKFIPDDRQPHIQVGVEELDGHYQFSVSDNGIGIKPEVQEKIFTIFKRLHSKDQYRGTGIGLAICKKIVEKHGGTIWVESDGKTGTTFFFTVKKIEQQVALRA